MSKNINKHISVLRINRLRGRMLYLPPPAGKKREILLLYGHHASLERMSGISMSLNKYGAVTLPDLPGFGGMDSFYKIGSKPTIDSYADYLASFIKLRYNRKRLTIMAMSFSFPVVTRMLQRYPEIAKKVDILVSCVGFVHYDDFRMPMWQQNGLKLMGAIFHRPLPSHILRYVFLQRLVIKSVYASVKSKHSKMMDANAEEFKIRTDAEVKLWQINDVRTRMRTMADMFTTNVCEGRKVDLKVYHVSVEGDRYFDNKIVEQHMRIIYSDFKNLPTEIKGHMPSIVATAEEASPFVPTQLKRILSRKP